MVALNEQFTLKNPSLGSQNRVGDFFCEVGEGVGKNRLASRIGTTGKSTYSYETASGSTCVNFVDPTGRLRQSGIDATGKDAGYDFLSYSSELAGGVFVDGAWASGKGLLGLASTNTWTTLKSIDSALYNYKDTFAKIKAALSGYANKVASGNPRAIGLGLFEAASSIFPVAKLSKLDKIADVAKATIKGADNIPNLPNGSFSITEQGFKGYPAGLPKPAGPFRLLQGAEYDAARKAANNANRAAHRADASLAGKQIHEIQPVKFGGSPTNAANKVPLTPQQHSPFTTWWSRLQRSLK
jgi:hypothetical protein